MVCKKTRRGVLLGFGLFHPIPRLAKTIHISNHICVTEHHNRLSVILNLTMATLLRISSAPVRHFHQMRKMIWLSLIFSFKRLANISFCNSLDAFASITVSKWNNIGLNSAHGHSVLATWRDKFYGDAIYLERSSLMAAEIGAWSVFQSDENGKC